MSSTERIEFDDMNKYGSNTELSSNSGKSNGGFHVSTAKAFILLLLGVLIAIVIGLIVHFAGNGKEIVCSCPQTESNGNNVPVADRITECKNWAGEGNTEIYLSEMVQRLSGGLLDPMAFSTLSRTDSPKERRITGTQGIVATIARTMSGVSYTLIPQLWRPLFSITVAAQ
ncbi:hypothetical protein LOTGIDRAFT_173195 [Lottia gigantea]|uniref:Uncharacterized protein n=1 Tax=Lottia gigantea TaxID=225164 RepID=V4A8X6_LOTGI|nr:hypothetical protein LOTGIDRAFT_173195 [Lottia gigantea]ESP00389.1 hypothetical protein LOTGIDRAFT_173195 [Lottia gigantea]